METVRCEVCVEGVPGALAAAEGGAHRIELCAGLVEGGTTPSLGALGVVLERVRIDTTVLVRPRGGDFLYTPEEMEVMIRDVRSIRDAGAFGIAIGALARDGGVDEEAMAAVMEAAGPMSVTFHRAFDMARDPWRTLDTLVELGVDRILTSGLEKSVPEGTDLIRGLVSAAGGRISIMPGGGIRRENVAGIVRETGVREVHFTAFTRGESPMLHQNSRPRMGAAEVPGEFDRLLTDPLEVRAVLQALDSASLGGH